MMSCECFRQTRKKIWQSLGRLHTLLVLVKECTFNSNTPDDSAYGNIKQDSYQHAVKALVKGAAYIQTCVKYSPDAQVTQLKNTLIKHEPFWIFLSAPERQQTERVVRYECVWWQAIHDLKKKSLKKISEFKEKNLNVVYVGAYKAKRTDVQLQGTLDPSVSFMECGLLCVRF